MTIVLNVMSVCVWTPLCYQFTVHIYRSANRISTISRLTHPCFIFRMLRGQLVRAPFLYLEVAAQVRTLVVMKATQRMKYLSLSRSCRLEVGQKHI